MARLASEAISKITERLLRNSEAEFLAMTLNSKFATISYPHHA